ncbi:MAG: rod shape-determining protein MreD [Bacteroidales bacterium]|nr:rod shape-determining protein MreD [Bacteroidales bacterium]
MNNTLTNIIRCVIALLLQIFICNYIHLFGFLTPAVYLFALFLLPAELPKSAQYLIAFAMGFVVDMFTHTLGVNAAASIILMYARPYINNLMNGRKTTEVNDRPVPANKDFRWMLGFTLLLTLIHQTAVVMLETFTFRHFGKTLLVILGDTLLTVIVILSIDYLFYSQTKRA